MKKDWDERAGLIALHQLQGVGWHTLNKMVQAGWEPDRRMTEREGTRLVEAGVPGKTVDRIREKWTPDFVRRVIKELDRREIIPLTLWDSTYPQMLKELSQPPWVLYVKGDSSLLSGPCLAVVGTRKPSSYGKQATHSLSENLAAQGWVIVSGMAAGVDGEAHRAALDAGGKTVAVLGSGVDVVYPKHHRSLYQEILKRGAACSEMPPGTQPHPGLFPQRNRVISGLSFGSLVVEAAERSGSLITADFSMEQGREVFAVPGPITSENSRGTNRLIQQGAKSVLQAEDVLEEFPYLTQLRPVMEAEDPLPELGESEKELLSLFTESPVAVDALAEKSERPIGEIHQHLLSLQVKGYIRQLPGAQFIKV
ncbi:DNA-processing protein DprA [Paludifilum halophilum]|uniref:DNA-processing protein DprA n=1 Tax=Paludifilum halophilum TaxID=1642702 RepID=UPI00146CF5F0|nr:DNA-processing protein DprA [Paludifilum halophilum]